MGEKRGVPTWRGTSLFLYSKSYKIVIANKKFIIYNINISKNLGGRNGAKQSK